MAKTAEGNSGTGLDRNGWLVGARWVKSPNYNQRPEACDINALVIHNISLPPGQFGQNYIDQFFTNCLDCGRHPFFAEIEGVEVSAHFLINRQGEVTQYVSVFDRAWHAGQSSLAGELDCNNFSIGIELEGCDDSGFEGLQYIALQDLAKTLIEQFPAITRQRIVGHSDIAPGRKTDPGPFFDWSRLRCGLDSQGVWG